MKHPPQNVKSDTSTPRGAMSTMEQTGGAQIGALNNLEDKLEEVRLQNPPVNRAPGQLQSHLSPSSPEFPGNLPTEFYQPSQSLPFYGDDDFLEGLEDHSTTTMLPPSESPSLRNEAAFSWPEAGPFENLVRASETGTAPSARIERHEYRGFSPLYFADHKYLAGDRLTRQDILCAVCQDPEDLLRAEKKLVLGTLEQIRNRQYCPICRMVAFTLEKCIKQLITSKPETCLESTLCTLVPHNTPVGQSMEVIYGGYPCGRVGTSRINSSLKMQYILSVMARNDVADFVLNRFNRCLSMHPGCQIKKAKPIEMLLFDTRDMCLVSVKSNGRNIPYIALSYVNGGAPMMKTKRKNLERYHQVGAFGSGDCLPQTIQDAIKLTKAVLHRYLWVDTLCIVQDDFTKYSQIEMMDQIYAHANLTIVALSGNTANDYLPGVQKNTRYPLTVMTYFTDKKGDRRFLESSLLDYEQMLKISPYETRAWTFQERILSRRCIYLSNHQAVFTCGEQIVHEIDWLSLQVQTVQFDPLTHSWLPRDIEAPRDAALDEHPEHKSKMIKWTNLHKFSTLDINNQSSLFECWRMYGWLVSTYSGRILSYSSDILNAFQGVTSQLEKKWQTTFIQGLPLKLFLCSLIWFPSVPLCRRIINNAYASTNLAMAQFPSWSWAGWFGEVFFPVDDISTRMGFQFRIISLMLMTNSNTNSTLLKPETGSLGNVSQRLDLQETTTFRSASIIRLECETISLTDLRFKKIKTSMTGDMALNEASAIIDPYGHRCGILLDFGEASTLEPHLKGELELILLAEMRPRLSNSGGSTIFLRNTSFHEAIEDYYSKQDIYTWKILTVMMIKREQSSQSGRWRSRVAIGYFHSEVWAMLSPYKSTIHLI
jgi:Heterokaryon incompatibility protein (HET)